MIVNGNAGVDPCVLRHQITDLQQDVTCIPGEDEGGRNGIREKEKREKINIGIRRGTCYLISIVKRLLLVTGFWSGPFRVTLGLGRPHTLQQRTTVSPNAHTTSDRGTRNSGATAHRKHTTQY